jgi:hypothetical protein
VAKLSEPFCLHGAWPSGPSIIKAQPVRDTASKAVCGNFVIWLPKEYAIFHSRRCQLFCLYAAWTRGPSTIKLSESSKLFSEQFAPSLTCLFQKDKAMFTQKILHVSFSISVPPGPAVPFPLSAASAGESSGYCFRSRRRQDCHVVPERKRPIFSRENASFPTPRSLRQCPSIAKLSHLLSNQYATS